MTSFSIKRSSSLIAAFTITSLAPLTTWAQAIALPPARTYHVDQYGQQTKVVKERWRDNADGEKQGIYLLYNSKGSPITKFTYTNGIKNGPAFVIRDDGFYSISFRLTMKFTGTFLNDKEEGLWEVNNVGLNGESGSLDRRMKYVAGNLEYVTTFRDGKMTATYKYEGGRKNGLARLYGANEAQYASGRYNQDALVGTWNDAGLEANKIVYRKNSKLIFENGQLISVINPDGSARSIAAEKTQKEAELQRVAASEKATAQALALDIRLSSLDLVQFGFYTDSYTLPGPCRTKLDTLAKQLNMRQRSSQYRVRDLYMIVYSTQLAWNASEASEKMLYILSLNRACAIKRYLFEKLADKDLSLVVFPCGGSGDGMYAGVKIFKANENGVGILKADETYKKLVSKYSIKFSDELIPSTILQESILAAARAYLGDATIREEMLRKAKGESNIPEYLGRIPGELWLTDIKEGLPANYAQVENTAQFRNKIEMLFVEMNKKYGTTLAPNVLFTDDLLKKVK